ncbi:MAG: L-rhamnose/proton symporter RhaT [Paludibacteraceae bacterium]|nr:L-rhamnose/proton symporter RhaT [Paludibacteraceae bacterium]
MKILIGLLIIAVGAFCQSSSYVPINKIKSWSWESYWLVQGIFAWLLFPFLGALLAVPEGQSLGGLFASADSFHLWMTVLFGVLWGVGGLTFGLSMRYLGVALGQSISLGTCAALGTILGPVLLQAFFPEMNAIASLTASVLWGVAVTLIGIAIIGVAGGRKAREVKDNQTAVADFNFPKGIFIALLAGCMSGCFNVGLTFGQPICFEASSPLFASLPATLLVTLGGFLTNASYCLYQNAKNRTFSDDKKKDVWCNNQLVCGLAGLLWYSQFFGLSLGKGFLAESETLLTFSFCILMALNVTFSNVWGIILKEWKGASRTTFCILIVGLFVLIISSFLPQLLQ